MLLARRFIRIRKDLPSTIALRRSSNTSSSAPKATEGTTRSSFGTTYQRILPIIAVSSALGFAIGRQSFPSQDEKDMHLPNGLPRTCCDQLELTEEQKELFKSLKRIVGKANVIDGREERTETAPFLKGARLGKGSALCIVKPQKLKELVEIVQAVVDAGCVVLVQGRNTGLVRDIF